MIIQWQWKGQDSLVEGWDSVMADEMYIMEQGNGNVIGREMGEGYGDGIGQSQDDMARKSSRVRVGVGTRYWQCYKEKWEKDKMIRQDEARIMQ